MSITRDFHISLIEHETVWADKGANMSLLGQELSQLPIDTDLVLLPEMFTTGVIVGDSSQALSLAEPNTGDTMTTLKRLGAKQSIAFAGSFLARTAGTLFNRGFFLEPNDDETYYDKRHIFGMGGESEVYHAGHQHESPIVRFRGLNFKLIVCYDLRFPVFCRNVDNAYDVLLVTANWPVARQSAWRSLLIARAIENQCYVCGVNRCGADVAGVDYGNGSSIVVDFKGNVIAERTDSPIISAELSPTALAHFREKFPAWKDADDFKLL